MKVRDVVNSISSVLPAKRPIGHHEAYINGKEKDILLECLAAGATNDNYNKKLTDQLVAYCGTEQAVTVSSGTAALHLALMAVGVLPGEEVLVPTLTFAATANAVCYVGAVPNFVDGSMGVNAYKLRRYLEQKTKPTPDRRGRLNIKTNRVISALVVVDLLGFPADYVKLSAVADEFGLVLIEDAAQALGSSVGNRKCGSFGAAAIFSFNNNKIVTGNGGGAVLTDDVFVASKVWQLSTTSRVPHKWLVENDAIAYNYRMPNICAALASAQLSQIDEFLLGKLKILGKYDAALAQYPELEVLKGEFESSPNYWLTTIRLKPAYADFRDDMMAALHKRGIQARALFTPLHRAAQFAGCPRQDNFLYAEDTFKRSICLPSGVRLSCE